jgi:hypothetical protein
MVQVLHGRHARVDRAPATTTSLTRPSGAALVGIVTVLVAAWGALAPFVGPEFGYRPAGASAWQWSTAHWLLSLIPGAVALVAGLVVVSRSGDGRADGRAAYGPLGLVIVASGAWFVLGQAAWPTFRSQPLPAPSGGALEVFVNQLGTYLGPGLLLAALGGMVLKSMTRDRSVDVADASYAGYAPAHAVSEPGPAGSGPAGCGAAPAGTTVPDRDVADHPVAGRADREASAAPVATDAPTAASPAPVMPGDA